MKLNRGINGANVKSQLFHSAHIAEFEHLCPVFTLSLHWHGSARLFYKAWRLHVFPSVCNSLALSITNLGANNSSLCNYPAQNCSALQYGLVPEPSCCRGKKNLLEGGLCVILCLSYCDFWNRSFLETGSWTTKLMVSTCKLYKDLPIPKPSKERKAAGVTNCCV